MGAIAVEAKRQEYAGSGEDLVMFKHDKCQKHQKKSRGESLFPSRTRGAAKRQHAGI